MKNYSYVPKGVCSKLITFAIDENGKLHNVRFLGGCNGNLKAIGRLVEGKDAAEISGLLDGVQCGNGPTSCGDQFAQAIKAALAKMEEN